ncbi:DUF4333 domain-containing protein [Conexibacter stalactiti]|uniref:DUF4333 domain-containing protein n=1 Tax=Conexibacter stalactiti TaxID=1940611 RepID=A0ABU4HMI7_9ACTN|nr:DUF4333 domain-containing protein [Conexibacter stalactiti]MDW5594526.1 DUF4333 domain-containing protein [Conexibacter stalactiti]MEC5035168.1 DUF4333 domain-containing protein [Conexibacter stalactiti]
MTRPLIRAALAALLASAALAVAGCGASVTVGGITIDHEKAQKMVVDNLSGNGEQISARAAVCPEDVDAEKGATFDCAVTWENGGRGSATVHIDSDDGDVSFTTADVTFPAAAIDPAETEAFVRENMTFKTGERAVVDCPDGIVSTPGTSFRCDLDVGGSKGTITLHITSREGDVRFTERDVRDAA